MVSDRQVRRLMSLLHEEQSLQVSADKAGMHRETAGKYRHLRQLPSALRTEHDWRTRVDPFVAVWPWVVEQLSLNPGLEAKTLLEALQRAHPGDFADGQLRTLQRQGKRWRGLEGPGQEVFFANWFGYGQVSLVSGCLLGKEAFYANVSRNENYLLPFADRLRSIGGVGDSTEKAA